MRLNKFLVVSCLMWWFPAASFGETFNQDDLLKTKSRPDVAGSFAKTVSGIEASAKVADARRYLPIANSKIAQEPNNDRYYFGRAQIYRDLQDYQSALADINHAIKLNLSNQFYYGFRGVIWANLNDWSSALRDTNKAIAIGPESADLYLERADALSLLNRYDESLVASNRSIALDPKPAKSYVIRGITKFYLKDYRGAKLDCKKAESMEPGNSDLTKELRKLLSTVNL